MCILDYCGLMVVVWHCFGFKLNVMLVACEVGFWLMLGFVGVVGLVRLVCGVLFVFGIWFGLGD